MQLVDGHFHWCFGEHLCAHVERQTRLDKTSRHVCDRLITARGKSESGSSVCVDALALGAEVLCQGLRVSVPGATAGLLLFLPPPAI